MRHLAKHRLRREIEVIQSDLIACVVCGKKFKLVCQHARQKHGMTAREYKQLAGLPLTIGLIGPSARENLAECRRRDGNLSQLLSVPRATVPRAGNPDKYQPKVCPSFFQRAKAHRTEKREKWLSSIEPLRDQFVDDWNTGTIRTELMSKYGKTQGQIENMRKEFSLPNRRRAKT